MTPHDLRPRLPAGLAHLEPAALLEAIEQRSDRNPCDRALAQLLTDVHGYATADDGIPPVVASVRRERLVRWDATSVTFDGTDVHTGRAVRVRVLRRHAANDPVLRRTLLRDARVLRDALGTPVMAWEGAQVAITCVLGGAPLGVPEEDDDLAGDRVLVRMLGTALDALARAESQGVGFPPLSIDELVDVDGRARLVCLTPAALARDGEQVSRVAQAIDTWWGEGPPTAVDSMVAGFATFPPSTAVEALQWLREALRVHLVGERHALVARQSEIAADLSRERLMDLVARLTVAVGPPQGRGAVGVDLEGTTTVLVGHGDALTWGDEPVFTNGELEVRAARRMVRQRAAARPSARLQAEVGGDDAFVDAACRWTSGSLALRTVRLLLAATP